MALKVISDNDDRRLEKKVAEFQYMPGIMIQSKHISTAIEAGIIYKTVLIFYETIEEIEHVRNSKIVDEKIKLVELITMARLVKDDLVLPTLGNISKKQMYLLTKYGISKYDSSSILDLLSPEMESVLNWSGC